MATRIEDFEKQKIELEKRMCAIIGCDWEPEHSIASLIEKLEESLELLGGFPTISMNKVRTDICIQIREIIGAPHNPADTVKSLLSAVKMIVDDYNESGANKAPAQEEQQLAKVDPASMEMIAAIIREELAGFSINVSDSSVSLGVMNGSITLNCDEVVVNSVGASGVSVFSSDAAVNTPQKIEDKRAPKSYSIVPAEMGLYSLLRDHEVVMTQEENVCRLVFEEIKLICDAWAKLLPAKRDPDKLPQALLNIHSVRPYEGECGGYAIFDIDKPFYFGNEVDCIRALQEIHRAMGVAYAY